MSDIDFGKPEVDPEDPEDIQLIKKLVSILQGAPYPTNVNHELYEIWYEHSLKTVSDALAYLDRYSEQASGS